MKYPEDISARYYAGLLMTVSGMFLTFLYILTQYDQIINTDINTLINKTLYTSPEIIPIILLFILGLVVVSSANKSFDKFLAKFADIAANSESDEISLESIAKALGYSSERGIAIIDKYLSNSDVVRELSKRLNVKLVYDKKGKLLMLFRDSDSSDKLPGKSTYEYEEEETATSPAPQLQQESVEAELSEEETVAAPQPGSTGMLENNFVKEIDMEETIYRSEEGDILSKIIDEHVFEKKLKEILGEKKEYMEQTELFEEEEIEREAEEETQVYY